MADSVAACDALCMLLCLAAARVPCLQDASGTAPLELRSLQLPIKHCIQSTSYAIMASR